MDALRQRLDQLLDLPETVTDEERLSAVERLIERCVVLENYADSQPEEYAYCGCSDPGCPCEGVKIGYFC